MVQVFASIFFSAAALGALSVIAASVAEEFGAVRMALGLAPAARAVPSARVRVRRCEAVRWQAMLPTAPALRAAA